MKKALLPALALALTFAWSCQSDELDQVAPAAESGFVADQAGAAGGNGNGNAYGLLRNCASMEVLNRKLQENPGLARSMEQIEQQARAFINAKPGNGGGGGKPGGGGGGETPTPDPTSYPTVTIPVIVHVIYNTTQQNISEAQIESQIAVLNQDYSASNTDRNKVPADFSGLVGNSSIQFELVEITRKYSSRAEWGTRDEMKFSSKGGVDAKYQGTHLNIWVCNIGGGILGYAQFPGGAVATDGVVVGPQFFGNTGYVHSVFNKGRTATHEVGHWLNLRHIWGDGRCNMDDYVADTPSSDRPNYGCPSFPTVHCNTADMTMNYMDYTDDACMYMFSHGQVDRMRAVLNTSARSGYYTLAN